MNNGRDAVGPHGPSAVPSEAEKEKPSSLTMLKGLRILEHVASHSDALAVGDIASTLMMDKSTVSRLLSALRTAGYVRQGRDRRYQLTSKLLFLTRNFRPAEHLRDIARGGAVLLHQMFQETIHVAALDAGEIVFVDFLESPQAVRIQLPTVPSPLHVTAIGRAALAFMSEDARTNALQDCAKAAGITLEEVDTEELRASLKLTAHRGYSTYSGGDGGIRLAAPILDGTGQPIGGVSISGPAYRIGERVDEIGPQLVSIVAEIRG